MSYFKCKDCLYYKKGFLIYNECTLLSHDEYPNINKSVVGLGSACAYFESGEYTCGQCDLYEENGKCRGKSGKRYTNHPACWIFKPKSDCFLTSACVEYLGKSDDCAELTSLRNFRDTYLKATENGQKLIKEYYEIAPEIVKKINASGHKSEYYSYIYQVITNCISFLSQNENEQALKEYKAMVLKLKSELL